MVIKTISVTYGRKFNLGNYNSAEIAVTEWADIEETENVDERLGELFENAKAMVKTQAIPLMQQKQAA